MKTSVLIPALLLASVRAQDATTTSQDALQSYLSQVTVGISFLAEQTGFEELVASASSELSFINAVISEYPERYSEFNSIAGVLATNPAAANSILESISSEVTLTSATPIETGTAVSPPSITVSSATAIAPLPSTTSSTITPSQILVSTAVDSILASASEAAESILASASQAAENINGAASREVNVLGAATVAGAAVLGLAVWL